ncbi:hypothetical protein EVAR_76037_1 [Eumeta japonica]|uniref:Uncharacterized protein n=1 Tax=Eumeta variegata TaxID=151549 RepID=A0A4C1UAB1_EUMVA|nr:hypothetical protein EVAR_76037_1 [Eumeta japonica]
MRLSLQIGLVFCRSRLEYEMKGVRRRTDAGQIAPLRSCRGIKSHIPSGHEADQRLSSFQVLASTWDIYMRIDLVYSGRRAHCLSFLTLSVSDERQVGVLRGAEADRFEIDEGFCKEAGGRLKLNSLRTFPTEITDCKNNANKTREKPTKRQERSEFKARLELESRVKQGMELTWNQENETRIETDSGPKLKSRTGPGLKSKVLPWRREHSEKATLVMRTPGVEPTREITGIRTAQEARTTRNTRKKYITEVPAQKKFRCCAGNYFPNGIQSDTNIGTARRRLKRTNRLNGDNASKSVSRNMTMGFRDRSAGRDRNRISAERRRAREPREIDGGPPRRREVKAGCP